jgi:hypothetical protein
MNAFLHIDTFVLTSKAPNRLKKIRRIKSELTNIISVVTRAAISHFSNGVFGNPNGGHLGYIPFYTRYITEVHYFPPKIEDLIQKTEEINFFCRKKHTILLYF